MSARNLGEARATLGEARVLLVRLEKSAPYLGEGCLPPLAEFILFFRFGKLIEYGQVFTLF